MFSIPKNFVLLILVLLYCSCATQKKNVSTKYKKQKDIISTEFEKQEKLISTEYEKGYLKDGHKVSFWEYFDGKGNLVLKMNYDNGQILFLKPDTSEYAIKKDGEWIKQKLKVYPKYIGSDYTYYKDLGTIVEYPQEAAGKNIEGHVFVSFEVDNKGVPHNFKVEKGIGGGCDEAALLAVKEAATGGGNWNPAQIDGKTYDSRFLMPIAFLLYPTKLKDLPISEHEDLPLAKQLSTIVVTGY